jgi:hypothetical protein
MFLWLGRQFTELISKFRSISVRRFVAPEHDAVCALILYELGVPSHVATSW